MLIYPIHKSLLFYPFIQFQIIKSNFNFLVQVSGYRFLMGFFCFGNTFLIELFMQFLYFLINSDIRDSILKPKFKFYTVSLNRPILTKKQLFMKLKFPSDFLICVKQKHIFILNKCTRKLSISFLKRQRVPKFYLVRNSYNCHLI